MPSFREQDPEKKKAMRMELSATTIPHYLALLEARLATFSKYATLNTKDVLLHDIAVYAFVKSLRAGYIDHIPVTVADGYELIEQSFQKVATHPKVVEWYAIQHSTPKLKLTYFVRPGRGEPIRLALFMGDVAFEDERISPEEFKLRKPSLPFNQVPVLQVGDDGDVIGQSFPILRYVGSLSGLYPTANPIEAFQVDELLCLIDELANLRTPMSREKDPEKQRAMQKELADETIPKFLGHLDKRTAQYASSGPYAIGARLTVADLAIASLVDNVKSGTMPGVPANIVDPFHNLLKIRELVHAHPKVVE
ncbi:Glutathione s-transferase, partial [Globisporangium polare]